MQQCNRGKHDGYEDYFLSRNDLELGSVGANRERAGTHVQSKQAGIGRTQPQSLRFLLLPPLGFRCLQGRHLSRLLKILNQHVLPHSRTEFAICGPSARHTAAKRSSTSLGPALTWTWASSLVPISPLSDAKPWQAWPYLARPLSSYLAIAHPHSPSPSLARSDG